MWFCFSTQVSVPPAAPLRSAHTATKQGSVPDVRADERAARLLAAHTMPIVDMVRALYPSLYPLHDLPPDIADSPPPCPPDEGSERGAEGVWGRPRPGVDVPVALPPSSENLSSEGVFLLDTGEELLLYVGRSVSGEVMHELFTMPAAAGEKQGKRRGDHFL